MRKKSICIVLVVILVMTLIGCSSHPADSISPSTTTNAPQKETEQNSMSVSEESLIVEESTESFDNNEETEEDKSQMIQRNSFSMMYYLAIIAEEIRSSKDNRFMLEDIYTSLLNDINPGAIDEITQDHLQNLRDIIKKYLNISVKRDRLLYIHNQSKAAAIRSAVPNPIAILSMTNALDWKKLAVTVAYAAIDSYNNYKQASDSADNAYLMSGWELDDEEVEAVQKNRDRAFNYMVDMVQEYGFDGLLTLNEKAIEKFVEICAIESMPEKTKRLESELDTYRYLGSYWLELADCYFETNKYDKCLECVDHYKELATGIYRQDYNYLKILPKAIVAAQNVYSNQSDKYQSVIKDFADAILNNTSKDKENWATRYFVAQVCMDLFSRTNNNQYLETAYNIVSENVTVLLQEQRNLNSSYLNEVEEVVVEEPNYNSLTEEEKKERKQQYKDEKEKAKKYNKALKEKRKIELPSLYEPLVLNCELLFALADQLDISDSEKADIEAILDTDANGIFLTKPINDAYSFSHRDKTYNIEMEKDEIIIPADLMTAESSVEATITSQNGSLTLDDCEVKKVERDGSSIDSFKAYISSKKLKKYDWTADSKITVRIIYKDAYDKTSEYKFSVAEINEHWYGDKVVFKAE